MLKAIEIYVSVSPIEFIDDVEEFKKDPTIIRDKMIELINTKSNEDIKSEEKGDPIVLKLFPVQLSYSVNGVASRASCHFMYETEEQEKIDFLTKGVEKLKGTKGVEIAGVASVIPNSATIIITTDLMDEIEDEKDTIKIKKLLDEKLTLFLGDKMPPTYSIFYIEPELGSEHMANHVTTRALVVEMEVIDMAEEDFEEMMEDLNSATFIVHAGMAYGVLEKVSSQRLS